MTRSRRITRLPVFDLQAGKVIGRVRRVAVLPSEKRLLAVVVSAPGWRGENQCLLYEDVHALGKDAVTVKDSTCLVPLADQPDVLNSLRGKTRLYHTPVLTEGGTFLGDVEEFTVDPDSGSIAGFFVAKGLMRDLFRGHTVLPAHLIVTIGEDAIIALDEAAAHLEHHRRRQPVSEPGGKQHAVQAGRMVVERYGRLKEALARKGKNQTGDAVNPDTPLPTEAGPEDDSQQVPNQETGMAPPKSPPAAPSPTSPPERS